MLREPVAIGSWLVLASAYLAVVTAGARHRLAATILLAVLFFVSAGATRYWLRETHSRWQILAFVCVAGVMARETRRRAGGEAAWIVWLVWSAAAAIGVMLVRWRTEGSPI